MAYIEKKVIKGKTYYYLTETKRVGKKWKKTRKYLGTTPTARKTGVIRRKTKPHLGRQQANVIEMVKSGYSKKFHINSSLWKTERERLVSFVFNTNAIEGNTLTYDETDSVLKGHIPVKAKKRDIREAQNMKKCIDFLFGYEGDITEEMVLKLHSIEMGGVLPGAGQYRTHNVRVGDYLPPAHQDVLAKMKEFFEWYDSAKDVLHPFELAALVHLRFARIHPFADGNGRMSRLLTNFILMRNGYPILNVFDAEKILYYLVLRKVDYTKKEKPFVDYLFEVFVNQYKKFLS